jgi:hypothetical protein
MIKKPMKRSDKKIPIVSDMKPEYDFSGSKGTRGKFSHEYRNGHTVTIHKEDGTTTMQQFSLEEGAVLLEPENRDFIARIARKKKKDISEIVNDLIRSDMQLAKVLM